MARRKKQKEEKINDHTVMFSEKEIDMGREMHSMDLLKYMKWEQLQEETRIEFITRAIERKTNDKPSSTRLHKGLSKRD